MIRIMVMNGLLISLILIWTSAAKEPSAGYLIKSSTKPPTGPLNYSVSKPMVSLHETNKEILRRKFLCGSELGGVCVNKKKSCPSNLPSEKSPGKPYCSKKKDRCCYPDPTTAAPPTVVPTTTTTSEDVNWSDIRNACIKSNNYKTYQPLTLDICKEKCVEEDAINCQSIEYSSAQQMCAISEARSDSDDFIEPCFVDGWVFAEIELNTGPTTGAPTTLAPSNTTINGQTTNPPTTTAPSNTTNNVSSCNLVWNYEEDRPLIMIRETKTIVPPIIDIEISEDPNRIPEGKKLIFACPGENNQFNHVQGTHTKLHGECISHEQFKVCVNNYPEILDLSQLSCSSKMQPSIIKQDNDTSYEKSCEDIGGELYKFGYIYGDYREFKDLDTKFCFREKDQTTLWTSTNIDRIEISPSMRSMDPANFRTARGLAMNTFYSQKSQQETLKEILDKEVTSVWNDKACRNHGGHCVRGGRPCPKHLPHHTSQGEPFCTSFYRCCYSDQCDPSTCTYKGKKGNCSLDYLPGTTGVGSQECKKGCQCYIKNNKTLLRFKSFQERKELSKLLRGDGDEDEDGDEDKDDDECGGGEGDRDCVRDWMNEDEANPPLIVDSFNSVILPKMENEKKKIRIGEGKTVVFVCSKSTFKKKEEESNVLAKSKVFATCKEGILLDHELKEIKWENLGCEERIMTSTIPFQVTNAEDKKEQKNCDEWGSSMWQIVFEIDPEKSLFYPLIDVCFHKVKQTTVYSVHNIHGGSFEARYKPKKNAKIKWSSPNNIFDGKDMESIYKPEKQFEYFNTVLQIPDLIIIGQGIQEKYFTKGHLATGGDFITKAELYASQNFINALPQWNVFNNVNWMRLEIHIQKKAEFERATLRIITGGYNTHLKMGNKPIYLGNPNVLIQVLPVPSLIEKTVKFPDAVAENDITFIITNDPLPKTDPIPDLCDTNDNSMCDDIVWLNDRTKKEFKLSRFGCIYCFINQETNI